MMLSFEIERGAGGETINITCDAEGMSILLKALATLVGQRASHLHLCGPSSGGSELNETTPWGKVAVSEVMIDYAEGD
jgi:hypothetical protein